MPISVYKNRKNRRPYNEFHGGIGYHPLWQTCYKNPQTVDEGKHHVHKLPNVHVTEIFVIYYILFCGNKDWIQPNLILKGRTQLADQMKMMQRLSMSYTPTLKNLAPMSKYAQPLFLLFFVLICLFGFLFLFLAIQLFHFISFHNISFHFFTFHFISFHSILFYFILFHVILFYSILFHFILIL